MARRSSAPRSLSPSRLLALGLPLLAACSTVRYTEAFTPEGEVAAVRIEVDQGNIEVVSADEVWVERTVRAAEGTLELSHELVDGTLVLRARCTTPIPCAVDTVLHVPGELPVQISLGEGHVYAADVAALQIDVGEGTVEAESDGRLQASVAHGGLRVVLGEGAVADVAVGQGDLEASLATTAWDLDLSAADIELRDVEDSEGATARLSAMVPGGRILVGTGGQLAAR